MASPRRWPPTLVLGLAALAAPASALGADTYVDATRPDNTDPACATPATACKTIAGPGAALSKTGAGDTIFVVDPAVPTTYPQSIVLDDGKSLVSLSPDPAEVIIDNNTGGGTDAAVLVPDAGVAGTSTIEGFTIRSDFQAVSANRHVVLRSNVFDEPGPLTNAQTVNVELGFLSGDSVVEENTFSDPTPTAGQNQGGILSVSGGAPTISGNSFDDLAQALRVAIGSPRVVDNTVTGTRVGNNAGVALSATSGEPTFVHNLVTDPFFAAPSDSIYGLWLDSIQPISATLRRNRVLGHAWGVQVGDEDTVATMDSDLIAKSTRTGLYVTGAAPGSGVEVSAQNLTVVDTDNPNPLIENDIQLANAILELDSSIVGELGIEDQTGSTCDIAFSRGPTTSGTACETFQTSADPLFDDAPGDDYRLQPASTMIDAGDPQKPPKSARDLDGLRRALDGAGSCVGARRRDVGAYEFECSPPNTKITKGPKGETSDPTPTFRFKGSGSADDFLCKLDDKPFKPCDSPKAYGHQSDGKHTFRVRAVDPETTTADPSAAKRTFKVT